LDYTIQWLELRSVDFTAAAEDNFFLRAGDATASSKQPLFVLSVWFTEASCTQSESFLRCQLGLLGLSPTRRAFWALSEPPRISGEEEETARVRWSPRFLRQ
jgi:hypothetical protein